MSESRPPLSWLVAVLVVAGVSGTMLYLLDELDSEPQLPESPQTLPVADREFLWDAEHYGLVLTRHGMDRLRSAVASGDRAGIERCLAGEFRCERPTAWTTSEVATDEVRGFRSVPGTGDVDTGDVESLDAAEFADWMLELRSEFVSSPDVRFKLKAMRPADRARPAGTWESAGRLVFEGTGNSGGPLMRRIDLVFRTPRPVEATLSAGGWLDSGRVIRMDRVAAPDFLFEDVTRDWGVDVDRLHDNWTSEVRPVNTGGVYLCDYNRDGCVDMLVTDWSHRDGLILYRGRPGGGFEDVSDAVGLPRVPRTINAIFADLDGDGWEDLVLPGTAVWRNDAGRQFVDVTGQTDLDDWIYHVGYEAGLDSLSGVSVADFDRDGLVDLYITRADAHQYNVGSWIDARSSEGFGNQLLKNLGNWRFADVTRETGTDGGERSVFTSVWLDANNDGWPDVYVIHEFGPGALLVNEGGTRFRPVELAERSSDFGSMGLTCGDIDNDGHIDLYVSNMYSSAGNRVMDNLPPGFYDETVLRQFRRMVSGNQLHLNRGGLRFDAVGEARDVAQVGWGWGPALADLNNDGWLDIYATCGFMSRQRDKPDG